MSLSAAVPTQLRQQIDRWANAWIKRKFARGLELRALDPGPYNYPVEVFSEWRGKAFYICAKYRAKSRLSEDDFVVRSARMTLKGFGRFDLAYFRHTGRWFTVYRALTAAECLEEIEGNEMFCRCERNVRTSGAISCASARFYSGTVRMCEPIAVRMGCGSVRSGS